MKEANKIVRTITTENKGEHKYYFIDFMTFENFVSKKQSGYTWENHSFELHPYKWYDLRWIYQIPAYYILLRAFRNSPERINKQMHKRTSIATLITEILLATKAIIEFIKLFITDI